MAFICGFSIMAVELVAGKLLAPYFGSSIYVWGSVITVFMLMLSFGYLIGGKFSLHNPSTNRLSAIFITSGLLVLAIPKTADIVFSLVGDISDPRYGSLLAAFLIFSLCSVAMGMVAPYSVRLLTLDQSSSGSTAGKLYFVSTMGSAVGTLVTSFYLVLLIELNQVFILVGSVLLLVGVLSVQWKAISLNGFLVREKATNSSAI